VSGDLHSFPPDVAALLLDERAHVTVPDEARARLSERLASSVMGFGPPIVAAPKAAALKGAAGALGSAGSAPKWALLVAMSVGTGTAALAVAHSTGHVEAAHGSPSTAVTSVRRLAARPARPPRTEALTEPTETVQPELVAPASTLRAVVAAPGPPSRSVASLHEERALIDPARAALTGGDPARAEELLEAHRRRFPHGVLAEERDALQVRALAALGKSEAAAEALRRLRSEHPGSFLLEGAAIDAKTDVAKTR